MIPLYDATYKWFLMILIGNVFMQAVVKIEKEQGK